MCKTKGRISFSLFIGAVLLPMLILAFSSCKSREKVLYEKLNRHPIRTVDYWEKGWHIKPLSKRIKPAPPELLEYLHLDNESQGYSERPESYEPAGELLEAMKGIESGLAAKIRRLLEENLIGVFCVKELGGSGYMEKVRDKKGKDRYGIIVLDVTLLKRRSANEWATWRENSFYKPVANSSVKVRVAIEESENNTVANAFRYILLHELGHLLGNASKAHPAFPWPKGEKIENYPFVRLSWKRSELDEIISKFEKNFPERKSVRFYSFEKARLNSSEIIGAYGNFRNTNFVSMYASTGLWEDFAESFASYFHTIINKRPWQIIIEQENHPEIVIEAGWSEERCKLKRDYIKKWFDNPLEVNKH